MRSRRTPGLCSGRWFVAAMLFLATTVAHSDVRAQTPTRTIAQAELLQRWVDAQARQQRVERRFTGGSLLAVGVAGFAFGTALMLDGSPNNQLSKGGGVALIAAGAFGLGLGIHRLAVESEAEKVARRYAERWATDPDAATIARFEGELYAAAQHARKIQSLTRWLGVATAAAGVTVLVMTPFADLSNGGEIAGYVGGGLLALGGGINIGSSLVTPPPVKAWEAYERGEPPGPRSGRLWGVVPSFHSHYAGLSVVGSL